ncbi:MAG: TlpA family protein disulfide reductase [Deltaproteobacteria bacterium]|nr:TlpA family protein disulfide reductase [Deltaproteobacteria bacterium]
MGCDDGPAAPAPSRVIAVAADPHAGPNIEEFCDTSGAGPEAVAMTFPELTSAAPAAASGARWVNVWATWCAPCVEEIPRLLEFQNRLAEEGSGVELVFLSADRDDEAVTAFREEHPSTPEGPRLADPEALPAWATSIGLDEGATLPIHVFVDAGGRAQCARTGGVDDDDYDVIKAIVAL